MSSETTSHPAMAIHRARTTQRIRLGRRARSVCPDATGHNYPRVSARSSWVVVLASVILIGGPASGQTTRLDLYRGPVVSSSRIIGLGGAFTGVGDGVDGSFKNKAALANRPARSVDWFDYDVVFDFMLTPGDRIDFDADGRRAGSDVTFRAANMGASLLFDHFSIGLLAQWLAYRSDDGGDGRSSSVSFVDLFLGMAYAFDDAEWILGVGFNIRALGIHSTLGLAEGSAELRGNGFDVGVLFRPAALDWRFGAQMRFPVEVDDRQVSGDLLPADVADEARAPWELTLGASYFWGVDPARRYNVPHRSGDGRPSDQLDADLRFLMVAADLVVIGTTADAVNLEGMIAGRPRPAGGDVSVSLHLGLEAEIVSNLLRARLGGYVEPTRIDAEEFGRVHLTAGTEVRLFRAWLWQLKVSLAFDVSSGYQNVLFGIGLWN